MAADTTAAIAVNDTLSTTTVYEAALTDNWTVVEVVDRTASSTEPLWVTIGKDIEPADPAAAGDDCYYIEAGKSREIRVPTRHVDLADRDGDAIFVKILGDGNDFTVAGVR